MRNCCTSAGDGFVLGADVEFSRCVTEGPARLKPAEFIRLHLERLKDLTSWDCMVATGRKGQSWLDGKLQEDAMRPWMALVLVALALLDLLHLHLPRLSYPWDTGDC